jgi:hypothetical protein
LGSYEVSFYQTGRFSGQRLRLNPGPDLAYQDVLIESHVHVIGCENNFIAKCRRARAGLNLEPIGLAQPFL